MVSLQTLSNQVRELLFSASSGDHCCTQRGGKPSAGTSTLQDVNSFVILIKSCDSFVTHCFHRWSSSVDSFLNESPCCCCCCSSECQKIVKNVSQCFYRAQVDVLKRLFCPRRQTEIFSLLSEEKKPERLLTANRFMLAALFNAANQNIVVVALITTQLKMSVCIPGWLIVKWSHQTCSCREPLCDHFILYMKVYN